MGSAEGDIADPATLARHSGAAWSRIFHLAGRTYVPDSWAHPGDFYKTNVLGTANVLELARSSGTPVTFVSGYLYGKPEKLPISECSPVRPDNPYALSKHLAEQLCGFYHARYDLPITILRPFNVYGIGQNDKFLIPTILRQTLFESQVVVNDLTPRRDFVYLEDLVEALIRTLNRRTGYGVYNIGSGSSLSVREVIDAAQTVAQSRKEVVTREVRRGGEIDDVVADSSKASKELDWRPRHSFREGLELVISDMRRRKP
jgi:nucleoside-diphosphate-sugar epimerase